MPMTRATRALLLALLVVTLGAIALAGCGGGDDEAGGGATTPAATTGEAATTEEATTETTAETGGGAEGDATAGAEVFASAGCGSCHTLADAGSTGTTGPDLDEVLADKDAEFIHQSIVDPNAVIADGYQPDIMPQNFGDQLSETQQNDLVAYLQQATGG